MKAYFVRSPRTIRELLKPHLLNLEKEYVIQDEIVLSHIAYENFSLDMLVDRSFLENAASCGDDGVMSCLFVHERNHQDGILVVPEMNAFVKWAAYIKDRED